MPPPPPPPLFSIPPGNTARVRIINTTSYVRNLPVETFMEPPMAGFPTFNAPVYSFLVEHSTGRKVVFDLGVPKDYWNMSPTVTAITKEWDVNVEKNVADILVENRVPLQSIEAVVWSHWHWDHIGDMTTFPPTTKLIVGPGFKEAFIPGFPANPESPIRESDYQGREVHELAFNTYRHDLKIGQFSALDYFRDGSFYLLDSPGHAIGHLCGLARTSISDSPSGADTFIFMGGDSCHHGSELRPSKYVPIPGSLPSSLHPYPLSPLLPGYQIPCPGAIFSTLLSSRTRSAVEPFFDVAEGFAHDVEEARKTVEKVQEVDAREDIFVVIAHDDSLLNIVDFFPAEANEWREKGWGKKGRWAFLKDFGEACRIAEGQVKGGQRGALFVS